MNKELINRYSIDNESWEAIALRASGLSLGNESIIFNLINKCLFIPAGQILRGAGLDNKLLFNSYVLSQNDSESIRDLAKRITSLTEMGAGVGINVSSIIKNTGTTLKEVISIIGHSQEELWRKGITRTATMITVDFVINEIDEVAMELASKPFLRHCNLSVNLTDEVMSIITSKKDSTEKNYMNKLIKSVWLSGNPSFVFIDKVNESNPFDEYISSGNSCAEQFMLPNEGAPLGSLNLAGFVTDGKIDEVYLYETAKIAISYLDDVIDKTIFPSLEAENISKNRRRVGLGVMGLDTALRKQGIQYDSDEAVKQSKRLSQLLRDAAEESSLELAYQKGSFPDFKYSKFITPRRNSSLLSIAPTGGISSLCGISSGIEPLFGELLAKESIKIKVDIGNNQLPLKKSYDISPYWHIKHLMAWQRNIDSGISKTVNINNFTSTRQIKELIIDCWQSKLKSVSIFRDGSRKGAVRLI